MTSETKCLAVWKIFVLKIISKPKIKTIYYYNRWVQVMIEKLVKIFIFDKVAAAQKKHAFCKKMCTSAWLKNSKILSKSYCFSYYLHICISIWVGRVKISSQAVEPFLKNSPHRLWKQRYELLKFCVPFKEKLNHFNKILVHIAETVCRINLKFSENNRKFENISCIYKTNNRFY